MLCQLNTPSGSIFMVATDNTTVMVHINKQRGTNSWTMFVEKQKLLLFTESKQWILVSKHVFSHLIILADQGWYSERILSHAT